MIDPWTIAQNFIQQQNAIANANRQTVDRVAANTIGAQVDRNVAQVNQGYQQQNLATRNDYSTAADTVAYGRQQERDTRTHDFNVADYNMERKDKLSDVGRSAEAAIAKDARDFEQEKELEHIKRGDDLSVNSVRRYNHYDPADAKPNTSYDNKTVMRESGGDPNAKNPNSSATGTHQFLKGTWSELAQKYPELGLTPDGRTDPAQSERAFKVFTRDNQRVLEHNGVPVNDATTYAAHFLGAGGAVSVLRSPDDKPLAAILPAETIAANPNLQGGKTVGDFRRDIERSHGSGNSSSQTADASPSVRRYSDPTNQSTIPNSTSSSMREEGDNNEPPVSSGMKKYLADKGLVVTDINAFSQAALDRIPADEKENWITDPWDTQAANTPKRETQSYVRVRPMSDEEKAIKGGGPSLAETVGKKNTTEGPKVEVQQVSAPVFRDGRFYKTVQRADGTTYEAVVN